jgi:hypothetical protein
MTGRPTFGEFLAAAHHHLTGEPGSAPARGEVEEVSRSLRRVVILLGRYLQDTATAFADQPSSALAAPDPWGRARGQAREALHNAAGSLLSPGAVRPDWPAAPSASPLARRLDEVARCLAAGRDLLYTHFTPGPHGGQAPGHPGRWRSPANGSTGPCSPNSAASPRRSPATAPTSPSPPPAARPRAPGRGRR